MNKARKILFLPIFLGVLITSGCWDRREINELAIVGAIGFDKVTVDDRDQYRAVAYIYKPSEMGVSPENGSGKSTAPYWVASAFGETLLDAGRNISIQSPRFVFLANSDLIIIGERLAREDGVNKVMDLLLRHKDMRLRNYLCITEGDAYDLYEKGMPKLESTLVQEITGMWETSSITSKAFVPDVKEFSKALLSAGRDPVAGKIQSISTGNEQSQRSVKLTGAAIFKESKLAGWLTDDEVRGFLYAINRARLGIMPVKVPGSQQEKFSFEMTQSTTKIDSTGKDGNFSMTLDVKAEGNVGDRDGSSKLSSPEEIKKLEKLVADNIKQLIENLVHKAQSMDTDIIGFGNLVHQKYPKEWHKIKKEWRNVYSHIQVDVNVEVKIHRTGMIFNPERR